MKRTGLLFLVNVLLLSLTAQTRVDSLLNELNGPDRDYVFVVAHRGDWRNAPENSIDAIERAIAMKADVVEIDIRPTKDGDFVLIHDETIERTMTGKGNVSDYTVEELKNMLLKSGNGIRTHERIPTLKEALLVTKDRILVNIDKGGSYIKEIIPIIHETGTENQVIIKGSYTVDKILAQYGDKKGMLYMPIVNLDSPKAKEMIDGFSTQFKPIAFEVLFKTDDNPVLADIHSLIGNSRLWINTLWDSMCGNHDDEVAVKNPDKHWGWIVGQGTTIIQTDRPVELITYLESINKRKL